MTERLVVRSRQDVCCTIWRCRHTLCSYDTPKVIAVPVVEGSAAYLRWIDGAVAGR